MLGDAEVHSWLRGRSWRRPKGARRLWGLGCRRRSGRAAAIPVCTSKQLRFAATLIGVRCAGAPAVGIMAARPQRRRAWLRPRGIRKRRRKPALQLRGRQR